MRQQDTWYSNSFMGRLPAADRQDLLKLGHTQLLEEGQILIRQGDPGGLAYLVLDGRVNVTAVVENGIETLLAIRHPGDLVGEMAVISSDRRVATVTARLRTTLLTLPGYDLVRFLGSRPGTALALSAITGDRLIQAQAYRADAAAYSVEVRVARALLYQVLRMADRQRGRYCLNLKQSELAMLVGAKEGTVQKVLTKGERLSALVESGRGKIVIHDLRALAEFAELADLADQYVPPSP